MDLTTFVEQWKAIEYRVSYPILQVTFSIINSKSQILSKANTFIEFNKNSIMIQHKHYTHVCTKSGVPDCLDHSEDQMGWDNPFSLFQPPSRFFRPLHSLDS